MEGKTIKGYNFQEQVGQGSFGKVFKATKNEKLFAIKSIELAKPGAAKTAEIEESFAKQIRFHHPFLIDYIDTFRNEKGDVLYVVMQFCGGGDLEKMIGNLGYRYGAGLPEDKLMRIVIQLSLGVGTLHKAKILHRDIKAGNAIFDSSGVLKISDFGCGKQLEETMGMASTYTGTRLYVAPEIYRGLEYNYPADVWSLGVLFYYLCAGRLPFIHPNEVMIGELVKKGKYTEIPEGMCTPEMRSIIDSILLRQNPEDRPTIDAILRHPYIQKWADKLSLKQHFPPEIKSAQLGSEFIMASITSGGGGSDYSGGGGGGGGGADPAQQNEEEIREFMFITAKEHPEYTAAQFKAEYLEMVGPPWSIGRYNAFKKMQQDVLRPPTASSSSSSSSATATASRTAAASATAAKTKGASSTSAVASAVTAAVASGAASKRKDKKRICDECRSPLEYKEYKSGCLGYESVHKEWLCPKCNVCPHCVSSIGDESTVRLCTVCDSTICKSCSRSNCPFKKKTNK